jgi:hypothetical protein
MPRPLPATRHTRGRRDVCPRRYSTQACQGPHLLLRVVVGVARGTAAAAAAAASATAATATATAAAAAAAPHPALAEPRGPAPKDRAVALVRPLRKGGKRFEVGTWSFCVRRTAGVSDA